MLSLILQFKISIPNPLSVISKFSRFYTLPPKIPKEILHKHTYIPIETPVHHNNPEVERLLKEDLCDYPTFKARKSRYFSIF